MAGLVKIYSIRLHPLRPVPWTLSFWNEDTRGVGIHREDICLSIAAGIPEGTTDNGGSKGLQCGLVFDISFLVLGPR